MMRARESCSGGDARRHHRVRAGGQERAGDRAVQRHQTAHGEQEQHPDDDAERRDEQALPHRVDGQEADVDPVRDRPAPTAASVTNPIAVALRQTTTVNETRPSGMSSSR